MDGLAKGGTNISRRLPEFPLPLEGPLGPCHHQRAPRSSPIPQDLPRQGLFCLLHLCPVSWRVYLRGSHISAFLTAWKAPVETHSRLARVLHSLVFHFLCFSDCSELLRYKQASKELHQLESSVWKENSCLPSFSISGFFKAKLGDLILSFHKYLLSTYCVCVCK